MNGLSAERTALSWRRTGLSGVAAAAVLFRFDTALTSGTRVALWAAALALMAAAQIRQRQLRAPKPSQAHPALVAASTTAVAFAGAYLIIDIA